MAQFVEILADTLKRRRAQNPGYSLRAFSRDLGVSPSRLSRILRGQLGLSESAAHELLSRIEVGESERTAFLLSALSQHSRARVKRLEAQSMMAKSSAEALRFQELSEEECATLASIETYAVLECFQIRKLSKTVRGFARHLGIPEERAQLVLDTLEHRGMVRRRSSGYSLVPTRLTTLNDVPSKPIRRFNQEVLAFASRAIEEQPVEQRDYSTLTVAVSAALLPEVKSRIGQFRRDLNRFIEMSYADSTREPEHVYMMAIQLFRISEGK